jgi:hypothetical protein
MKKQNLKFDDNKNKKPTFPPYNNPNEKKV